MSYSAWVRLFFVSCLITLLTSCGYSFAPSTDLVQYQKSHGEHEHDPSIQMLLNDFGGLSTQTLQTNAIPLKIAATAVVMLRAQQTGAPLNFSTYLDFLHENGFITPSKIENLPAQTPAPDLKYPVGIVRGDLQIKVGPLKLQAEIANITCTTCHAGRTFDAQGRPTNNIWLGAPNTSINLQDYTQGIYAGLKFIVSRREEFLNAIPQVFPEISPEERSTITKFLFAETVRETNIFAQGSDSVLTYFNGPPGNANAIGSFKRVFNLLIPGQYDDAERGFVNIPDLSYRAFRRSLAIDGLYTALGETPVSPITKSEATPEHLAKLAPVAAVFLTPVMGMTPTYTEAQIPAMLKSFVPFVATYSAPKFPGPIDPRRAADGELVYRTNCMHCHGEFSPGIVNPELVSYPNKLVPVAKIGTDSTRLNMITKSLVKDMLDSWIGTKLQTTLHNAYVAPPLANIWSTAPYLHNGSVPSLWALMNSELRPTSFYVGGHALNFTVVGISYPKGFTPTSRPVLYDTTLPGQSNQGHEGPFLDLSQDDKLNLLEYLKLL